jgi:mercuric ion transport protein
MVRSLPCVSDNMSESNKSRLPNGSGFLAAGILAAFGASICCIGPIVLLALGISGAWIGSFGVLESYRPIFIGLTLFFLGFAFYRLYSAPRTCAPGSDCADRRTLKNRQLSFWIVALLALGLVAIPWFAPLF